MATLTAFKRARQLPIESLIATAEAGYVAAEAIQEMTALEICALCIYKKRAWCRDAILEDRLMCPVVRGKNGGI